MRAHGLGRVVGGPGFRIARDPDTVRAPDVAFIAAGRIPEGESPVAYPDLAPDLVVEVVSPGDRAGEIRKKVADWLAAGTRVVLVLYPRTRSAVVHRPGVQPETLGPDDELDGADVLPGFHCPVHDLFPTS